MFIPALGILRSIISKALSDKILRRARRFASGAYMKNQPETFRVRDARISCDGSGDVPAALGHPKVWLQIDDKGYADCGYCDRHFILIGGPADIKSTK